MADSEPGPLRRRPQPPYASPRGGPPDRLDRNGKEGPPTRVRAALTEQGLRAAPGVFPDLEGRLEDV